MPIQYVTPPAPREKKIVGTKNSGTVEIETIGGMTTEERETMQKILRDQPSAYVKAATLAYEIAQTEVIKREGKPDRKLTNVEAYKVVTNAVFGEPQKNDTAENVAIKYATRIREVADAYASSSSMQKLATVTAIVKHRLSEDETIDTVRKLHASLIDAIYELSIDESAAEKEDADDEDGATPPTEEELGKSQPEE
jgi:hypothetical protein